MLRDRVPPKKLPQSHGILCPGREAGRQFRTIPCSGQPISLIVPCSRHRETGLKAAKSLPENGKSDGGRRRTEKFRHSGANGTKTLTDRAAITSAGRFSPRGPLGIATLRPNLQAVSITFGG